MKTFPNCLIFFFCPLHLPAQQNCSFPTVVNICPNACLTNQTNAGMGDDAPLSCNLTGEDACYKVIVAGGGSTRLFVSITNASASLRLIVEHDGCSSSGCSAVNVGAGNSNSTFVMTAASYYNVWVDASTTVTYNICFGADTDSIYVNNPNTQGNWIRETSTCATPLFYAGWPWLQVSYNSVYQAAPLNLILNVAGTLCIKTYFRNTTGNEGVKKFVFTFNSLGYSLVTPTVPSIPGFYNSGNWNASGGPSVWTYTFSDAASTGRGDFNPPPNTCLGYSFCFNLTPVSNLVNQSNIRVDIYGDGWGAGYTGWIHYGCCPSQTPNCIASTSVVNGGSAHSYSFGIEDGVASLPITLTSFNGSPQKDKVLLKWTTSSEVNNNYFTVERSADTSTWNELAMISGAGNSTNEHNYEYIDGSPLQKTSYYRLKQTDFDGMYTYSSIREVVMKNHFDISIYPNPAKGELKIHSSDLETLQATIYNIVGRKFLVPDAIKSGEMVLDVSMLSPGIYFIQVDDGSIVKREKIMLQD